ncbi:MAG: phosphomannomutase/phosphoglucomutase [Candidatus Nanohaloarchaea archaeon]|jgi:phosphomannomutase/phosphoglucomutase
MTSFFHAYDLRGTYPDEISEDEAEKVGKAYGTFTDAEEVLVARDGRKHGEEITEAFISGVLSTGTGVKYAGIIPTPVAYHAQVDGNIESAAVVTASHNPSEYTGFKFCLEGALSMSREGGMRDIEEIYDAESFETGQASREEIDVIENYIEDVAINTGSLRDLNIAINCGNGVTGVMARDLFERLDASIRIVNGEVDGDFPNHLPAPGEEEAQIQLENFMDEEDDLGIIFDGDGDRAGFILPGVGYISEDEVLALFSEYLLEKDKGKVVHDLRSSKLVKEIISQNGGEPVESRVGHTFISEMIHSDDSIVFAGELSGHYYFPSEGFPWDDGLYAAALMARIVSDTDIYGTLKGYPDYPVSPELRIDCPHEAKQPVIKKVADEFSNYSISRIDGLKIEFDAGWALVRPSNTEEKMSVRVEADTEEELDRLLEKVRSSVENAIEQSI